MQTKIFPIYFGLQTVLPAVLALTYPGRAGPSSFAGVLDAANRSTVLAPLAVLFVTGVVNLTVILPATQKVMAARRAQGAPGLSPWTFSVLAHGRSRKEGRKEELRPGTPFAGDVGVEQAVWHLARHLVFAELGNLPRVRGVRLHLVCAIAVSVVVAVALEQPHRKLYADQGYAGDEFAMK